MKRLLFSLAILILIGAGCTDIGKVPPSNNAPSAVAPASQSGAKLDLSGKGMERVPLSVFDNADLEELNVSNNRLTGALPSQIQHLQNLRILDASSNEMTGVPAEIGQLSKLVELDLSNNKLTGLPFELGNLQQLRRLDLRGNDMSKQDLDTIRVKLKKTEILE